jgi:hypothetical protein
VLALRSRIVTDSSAVPVRVAPLYAAGFVTAFGAHSVAAGLGATGEDVGPTLLRIGVLLALYDVAEVILKPIFAAPAQDGLHRPLLDAPMGPAHPDRRDPLDAR